MTQILKEDLGIRRSRVEVEECGSILGTGQQIFHLQRADAAARLSSLASSVASLCFARSKRVDVTKLPALVARTKEFFSEADRLDSTSTQYHSFNELIPLRVWQDAFPAQELEESSKRMVELEKKILQPDYEPKDFESYSQYFRDLAAKLADSAKVSVTAAQDPLPRIE